MMPLANPSASQRFELPHFVSALAFFLTTCGIAVFFLYSATGFRIGEFAIILGLALLTVAAFGWLIIQIAIPDIHSIGIRLALVLLVGLIVSIHLGFFLGALGFQDAYIWVCIVSAGLSITLFILRQRKAYPTWQSNFWIDARIFLTKPTVWIIAGLGMLSIIAIIPLLAPFVRLTTALSLDYSYIDKFFHMARAQILSNGAPEWTSAETGGVKPIVYPDYYDFWIGMLIHWSQLAIRQIYLLYVPILQILLNVLVSYALGKTITGSPWGGFLAIVLCSIAFFPNPYDSNLLLRNIDTYPDFVMGRIRFLPWRGTLTYGLAWTMLSGTMLCLAMYRKHALSRTGTGLVTMAALLSVGLLRIRSNDFLILAPLFVLLILYWIIKLRDWRLFLALGLFALMSGAIYLESTSARYDLDTATLTLRYGVYGKFAPIFLPQSVRPLFNLAPTLLQPISNSLGVIALRMFGVVYGALFLYEIARLVRRRIPLTTFRLFLLAALGLLFIEILFVVRADPSLDAGGGDWSPQAVTLAAWLAILLSIAPLFHIARELFRRFAIIQQNFYPIVIGSLVVLTLISYRGADAALHDQTGRAYPVRAAELATYTWLKQTASPRAIVAAHPDYRVNAAGETIAQTNFLSGMTERPAYLQRVGPYNIQENALRGERLRELFNANSAETARHLLTQMSFDYLLVYPEIPPKIDLSCCLKLVKKGIPQVYAK